VYVHASEQEHDPIFSREEIEPDGMMQVVGENSAERNENLEKHSEEELDDEDEDEDSSSIVI